MGSSTQRPRLVVAANSTAAAAAEPTSVVMAADLGGLDLTRVPQELAGHVPALGTPWPRGTCLPPVDTPDGRQALCFGTAQELGALAGQWRGSLPINSVRTLWVATLR